MTISAYGWKAARRKLEEPARMYGAQQCRQGMRLKMTTCWIIRLELLFKVVTRPCNATGLVLPYFTNHGKSVL